MKTKLSSIGEFALIRRLKRILDPDVSSPDRVGIGDDASVLPWKKKSSLLLTHDLLLEGVHFLKNQDFRDIGWKALAVNLSDIAAMGGRPLEAVVGLGLPAGASVENVEALYRGLKAVAKKFACPILGGDTNASRNGWVVAVSVLGECAGRPLLRSGAKAGDTLWVTGALGGAALAWHALRKGKSLPRGREFLRRFLRPEPRLDWAESLRLSGMVTAALDISDGLAGDLAHLAEASGVGAEVEVESLPRAPRFEAACRAVGAHPVSLLLGGGEDYELLFTVRKGREARFAAWAKRKRIPVSRIGRTTAEAGLKFLEAGRPLRKDVSGYTHF